MPESLPLSPRWLSSQAGNVFQAVPRVTSTASAALGTHRRTNTKSSRSNSISTSASPAATAVGSRPTNAAGIAESATRSLSTVRETRVSPVVSADIHSAVLALSLADRRSLISRSNSSGGTKNGFS